MKESKLAVLLEWPPSTEKNGKKRQDLGTRAVWANLRSAPASVNHCRRHLVRHDKCQQRHAAVKTIAHLSKVRSALVVVDFLRNLVIPGQRV